MGKIAITTSTFCEGDQTPLDLLQAAGFEPVLNPHARQMKSEEVLELARDAVGIIAGTENLGGEILRQMPRLKVISRCGIGTNNIDIAAAKKLGIQIFNTPDAVTPAVAELTVGLILNLLRHVDLMHLEMKTGVWKKRMGNLLRDKKVGIVGFGRIGRRVAELLLPFGAEISYSDPRPPEFFPQATARSLDSLLAWSEIMTLHCSPPANSKPLLGREQISLMKKGAFLINTSRGSVLDEAALFHALKNNSLSGTALDVFCEEPYKGPLLDLTNVILTPHIGSYAAECRIQMEREAVQNLLSALKSLAAVKD